MARMYGLEIPYEEPRSELAKTAMAELACAVDVPTFVPNAEKARAIQSQVEKEAKKEEQDVEAEE